MKESTTEFGSYLVCKEYIKDVAKFLSQFFEEVKDSHSHSDWATFNIPGGFLLNLMRGDEQDITQNFTIEIYCNSLEGLQEFVQKHNSTIKSFDVTKTTNNYRYHYVELKGPANICKMEASFSENL